jgi:uncharacterized protein (TIRG00374 family)
MFLPGQLKLSQWLNQRFPHHRLTQLILSFLAAVHIYQKNKMVIVECLAASLLVQMLVASATALIAKMLGFSSLAFSHYLLAVGITQIVNLIPLTPGGIGIGETAFAHILLLFNPSVHAAFATIFFVYRLISLLTYLPGALCYLPKILFFKKKNPLQEESAGA